MKEERRRKFDAVQADAKNDLRREMERFDKNVAAKATTEEKNFRKDLDLRLERLLALEKKREDLGPVSDCVVFHDGRCEPNVRAFVLSVFNFSSMHSFFCRL
jgi:tripeptidyl-peptidase-2